MFWWRHLICGGGLAIPVPERKTVLLPRDDGRALAHYLLDLSPQQTLYFPSVAEALDWLRTDLRLTPGRSGHVVTWRADDRIELWQKENEENPVLAFRVNQSEGASLELVAIA